MFIYLLVSCLLEVLNRVLVNFLRRYKGDTRVGLLMNCEVFTALYIGKATSQTFYTFNEVTVIHTGLS
jgi:hypothetical protein